MNLISQDGVQLLSFSPDRTNDLVSPFLRAWDFIKIVGVSYGLVCYCNSFPILPMSLVICNPLTRKFFSIPENPELIKPPRSFLAAFVLGFTVDSDSNDYKLIKIQSTYLTNYKPKKAWIYTMNKGCWKRIYIPTPISDDICLDRTSEMATLGDSIHWSCRQVASDSTVILSFNWSHKSFGVISAAQHFRDLSSNSKSCFHLSQLNGELAYSGISDVGVFNVWTLDAYAVGWIMKFSIELVPLIARLVEVEDVMSVVESFRFVGRMRDSDLVFVADEDKSLFLYDLARGEIKRLPFDHDDYCYTVHGYTESLVPVKKNG